MEKTIKTIGIITYHGEPVEPNTVDFEVNYPKGYEGTKAMLQGSIQQVAADAGEYFESLGIGKVIGKTKAVAETVLTEPAPPLATPKAQTSITTEVVVDDKPTPTAAELIASINEATSAEAVDALVVEKEERKTVLAAAEAKKKSFA